MGGFDDSYYEDLRGRARALVMEVEGLLSAEQVGLLWELVDANETGVAVEMVSDLLAEMQVPITESILEKVRSLVATMGLPAKVVEELGPLTTSVLIESDDRWVLPLAGRSVDRLCFDFAVTLMIAGGFELRIEQPFVLDDGDGAESLLVPEGTPEDLAPALRFVRCEIVRAEAFKDGHAEIEFSDGLQIGAPADEGFEAWELVGPSGLRVTSLPGGELAVWCGDHDIDANAS